MRTETAMHFNLQTLDAIAAGSVTVAFRRWRRVAVRPGSHLRTAIGMLAIESVEPVRIEEIAAEDVARAGFPSREVLHRELSRRRAGEVYRVAFRLAGPDPRLALYGHHLLSDAELANVRRRLALLDAQSRDGAWTFTMLCTIADAPGRLAGNLAASLGMRTPVCKAKIRQLKALGLTETLPAGGYRLSPRGATVLAWLADGPRRAVSAASH